MYFLLSIISVEISQVIKIILTGDRIKAIEITNLLLQQGADKPYTYELVKAWNELMEWLRLLKVFNKTTNQQPHK